MSAPDPQPNPTPFPWLPALATAATVAVLLHLPLMGIDREAMAEVMGPQAARLPVFLAPLALAALATSPRTGQTGGRALLIFAVFASGGLAWSNLAWLAAPPYGMDALVLRPGLGALALAALSSTAVHALLLALAARLDGPRLHGLWWVLAVAYTVQWLPIVQDTWWSLAVEQVLRAGVMGVGLLPAVVAGAAWATLRPSTSWIRSTADAWALPLLAAAITADGLSWSGGTDGGWALQAAVLVAVPTGIVGLAIRDRTAMTPLPAVGLAVVGLLAVGSQLLIGAATDAEALAQLFAPGPLDGDVDASIPIHSDDPGPHDVEVLQARIDRLGVEAQVKGQGGEAVVHLRGVRDPQVVLGAFLPRRAVTFRAVVEDGHDEPVDLVAEDCASDPCRPMSLGVAVLDAHHIADATTQINDYGEPTVHLGFTADGAQRFGDWTAAMVHKRIAIVVDTSVASAPSVMEPIRGGRAVIQMGRDTDDGLVEAKALSTALSEPPLQGHWTVR